MNNEVDDLTKLRAQLAPLSYEEVEALIGRADNLYDLAGYKEYLGEQWNEQAFADDEAKGYCWNLILFCIERRQSIRQVVGYGSVNIKQRVQLWP